MTLFAFPIGWWVGARLEGSAFALTNGVWFCSVWVAVVAMTLVRRHGEARPA